MSTNSISPPFMPNQATSWSPSLTAILDGRWDVSLLNPRDETFGRCDRNGNTPLHRAAQAGKRVFVEAFAPHCPIERRNALRQSPFFLAVDSGDLDTVDWFLAQNVSFRPKGKYPWGGQMLDLSPIELAVARGHRHLVERMLRVPEIRENCFEPLPGQDNLLHIATRCCPAMATHLLESYPTQMTPLLSVLNQDGRSPLEELSHLEGIQEKASLFGRGISPEVLAGNRSALQWQSIGSLPQDTWKSLEEALLQCDRPKLKDLIQASGAKPDRLLDLAIRYRPTMVPCLLREHYRVIEPFATSFNGQGRTPLMEAALLGNVEAIDLLQRQGVPLEQRDPLGNTALHWALRGMQPKAIDRLCFHGCSMPDGPSVDRLIDFSTVKGLLLSKHAAQLDSSQRLLGAKEILDRLHRPETLVITGGGAKGVVYEGAVCALEDRGFLKDLRRVAGTSAGAITAAMLAVGCSAKDFVAYSNRQDLGEFLSDKVDPDSLQDSLGQRVAKFLCSKAGIDPLSADLCKILVQKKGFYHGEKLRTWIESVIAEKTGIAHCTFGELAKMVKEGREGFRHLHMIVTDLGTCKAVQINSEDPEWENVIISDATRASASVPIVYTPHYLHEKIAGKRLPRENSESVDGGLLENCPISWFDKTKYLSTNPRGDATAINPRTLALFLVSSEEPKKQASPDESQNRNGKISFFQAAYSVGSYFLDAEKRYLARNPANNQRLIRLDAGSIGLADFGMSEETKAAAARSGYDGIMEFDERMTETRSKFAFLPWHRDLQK